MQLDPILHVHGILQVAPKTASDTEALGSTLVVCPKFFVDMQQDSRNGQQENLVGNRHFIGMDLSLLFPLKLSKLVVLPFAGQIRERYNCA